MAAVATVLVVFGALATVTQVSSAKEQQRFAVSATCGPSVPGAGAPNGQDTTASQQNGRTVWNYWGDGQQAAGCQANQSNGNENNRSNNNGRNDDNRRDEANGQRDNNAGSKNNGGNNNGGNNNGGNAADPNNLGILASNCKDGSKLQPHDGFQNGNRCVGTEMGEVGDAAKNPSLLITQAPRQVQANQPFTIKVSTRNLIRDRFLAAAKGGYYAEMSLLNAQGLVRGHFHTACRMLDSTQAAPDPAPPPAFFVATEDGGGSARPDQIVIQVPGLPQKGTAQCASWAGDGSHRIPMMQRANEIPSFDAVRITVN